MNQSGLVCPLCASLRNRHFSSHQDGDYFQCLSCRLLFAHPLPSTDVLLQQAEYWAGLHHASSDKIESDFSPFIQEEIHLSRLRRIERLSDKGKLLDLGCATGAFLFAAQSTGWDAVGIECAEQSALYGKNERGLNIQVGSFAALSFPDSSFHAITLWEFLEHVDNPFETLGKAHRLLCPGGILALSTPNLSSLTKFFLREQWDVFSPAMHLFLFSPLSLRRALQRAGFKKFSIFSEDVNPLRILGHLRSKKVKKSKGEEKWEEKQKQMSTLKALVQKKGWARSARRVVNRFLHVCRVGDTLIAYARK